VGELLLRFRVTLSRGFQQVIASEEPESRITGVASWINVDD
jgi:hypothetical protein